MKICCRPGTETIQIIKYVFEKEIDLSVRDKWGNTVLYYASSLYKNYVDVIVTLIKCNVDLNQKNKRGDTVLMKLCDFNKIHY